MAASSSALRGSVDTNAMRALSGAHEYAVTFSLASVTVHASPPSARITWTCALTSSPVPRADTKLIKRPLGDHCGWLSPLAPNVICRAGADPLAATFQTCVRDSMRSLSETHSRTVYSTWLPSGEMVAPPTALTLSTSSNVTARFAWANGWLVAETSTSATATRVLRITGPPKGEV